jgi:SsrA-binding protein
MAAKSQKSNKHSPETVNKKAYHNFELIDKYQAGLALKGSEVKSLRSGTADLSGSYARLDDAGQCWLVGVNISQYKQDSSTSYEPLRKRKLLLHKAEIRKIRIKLEQRGFTLVPLRIYFNDRGLAKTELALAKGKRQFDKRQTITERDQKRDIDRSMRKFKR